MSSRILGTARMIWALLALCAGIGLSRPPIAAQEPIRIQTGLVPIPVIVTDAKGRYAAGLSRDSFRLFHDGVAEPITYFAATEEPLQVALLLDTSKSTLPVLGRIRKGARAFLDQLRPHDRALIVSFDSEVRVQRQLTGDREGLKEAVQEIQTGAGVGTHLRDALSRAVDALREQPGRRAAAILTDGQDFGSVISAETLANQLDSAGVQVYPVFYQVDPQQLMRELLGVTPHRRGRGPSKEWLQREKEAELYLEQIAELTAGNVYRSEAGNLHRAFGQVATELRNQYLLGFYPDRARIDGLRHSLRVEVSIPGATVRARPGYLARR